VGSHLGADLFSSPLNVGIIMDTKGLQQVLIILLRHVLVVSRKPASIQDRP
jgi:hypothetical protein